MMNNSEKPKRICQLEGMRFIMCLMILLGHCAFLENASFGWITKLQNSTLPLDYFFILSGFGIYLGANQKDSLLDKVNIFTSIKWAILKIKKIYPLYALSLLFYLPLYYHQYHNLRRYIVFLTVDLTLLQSLAPTTSISHLINGPFWFLSALFISYMLCPVFFKWVKNAKREKLKYITIVTLVLIGVSRWVLMKYANAPFFVLGMEFKFDIGSTPYSHCFKLLLGMILARFICEKNYETKKYILAIVLIITLCFHWMQNLIISAINYTWWLSIVNVCLTCVFIFSLATCHVWGDINAKMIFGGKLSMYIYLFHFPVMTYAQIIKNKIFGDTVNDIVILVEVLLIYVVTLLLSICLMNISKRYIGSRHN